MAAKIRQRPKAWRGQIEKIPDVLGGKPVVKGTRISVELITDRLEGGETEEEILRSYPHIVPEDIEACRRYKATGAKLSKLTRPMLDAWMESEITPDELQALREDKITWEELHTLKGGGVTWAQLDALRQGKITWEQLDALREGKITWAQLDATMGGRYRMIWPND